MAVVALIICVIVKFDSSSIHVSHSSADSAAMSTTKIHQNSVLSTPQARYTVADAGNMYLASYLKDAQYIRFKLKQIPKSIQAQYQLHTLVDPQGCVYAKIKKALCGLKESGRIANEDMVDHLASFGYNESKFTKGLFKHESRDISSH